MLSLQASRSRLADRSGYSAAARGLIIPRAARRVLASFPLNPTLTRQLGTVANSVGALLTPTQLSPAPIST